MIVTDFNVTPYSFRTTGAFGWDPAFSGYVGLARAGRLLVGLRVPRDAAFGIYQTRSRPGRTITVLESFYGPTNPQTIPQQANRAKMTAAVAAWQALSAGARAPYNARAVGKNLSGYNLYLREYILTH